MKDIIKKGMDDYKKTIKALLIAEMDELYGGPKQWSIEFKPQTEAEEQYAVAIWNDAIKLCQKIVGAL